MAFLKKQGSMAKKRSKKAESLKLGLRRKEKQLENMNKISAFINCNYQVPHIQIGHGFCMHNKTISATL